MPYYLLSAGGVQNTSFAWSVHAVFNSASSEAAVASAWNSGWQTLWGAIGALLPTTTTLTFTAASTATATFKQSTKTRTTVSNAGAGTTTPLPLYAAPVLTLRSANATKYGHGRWYFPSVDSGALATGGYVLAAASVTSIVNGVNGLFTATRPLGTFQILHRRATLHGPGANTTDTVVAGDVSNLLHVQRRRQNKVSPTRTAVTP